jgi:hypothetical protein
MEFAWKAPRQSVSVMGDLRRPTSIRFNDFGNIDEMVRVEEPDQEPDVSHITGRYRYEALDIKATIVERKGGACLDTTGCFGAAEFSLERIADGIWRAKPAGASRVAFIGGILTFCPAGFGFANFQTRPLLFRRVLSMREGLDH